MECVPHQKQNWGMQGYIYFFLSFAQKHKIVGTSLNRLGEAVITCTHTLGFEQTFSTEKFHLYTIIKSELFKAGAYLRQRLRCTFKIFATYCIYQ